MPVYIVIVGFIYFVEVLSVIIQVAYFKKTGKRVFKMAPIHHHFESESDGIPGLMTIKPISSKIISFISPKTTLISLYSCRGFLFPAGDYRGF